MSREKDGIATRSDINTLSTEPKYNDTLTRCVPKSDFNNDENYSISGEYADNQLLKFEDVSWVFVPGDEPEPDDISAGDFRNVKDVLIENTGYPNTWYLAENGSGVLKVKFNVTVIDDDRRIYPTQPVNGSSINYMGPVDIYEIGDYDTTNFSAWTTDNNTVLNIKPRTNNTNLDEKKLTLTLQCHITVDNLGEVRDEITRTYTQIGYTYKKVGSNLRTVYYNENDVQLTTSALGAHGHDYALVLCELQTRRMKTDSTAYTVVGTTATICRPVFDTNSNNTEVFTINPDNHRITAQNLGTTVINSRSATLNGYYQTGDTGWYAVYQSNGTDKATSLVTQSANYIVTTETTYSFTVSYEGYYYDSHLQKAYSQDVSYQGTIEPDDIDHGQQGRVIHVEEFEAVREYDWTVKWLSNVIVNSGYVSGERVTCDTMTLVDGYTYPAGTMIDRQELTSIPDPFLLIPGNYSSIQPRDFPVVVGYSEARDPVMPTATFTFTQYGAPQTICGQTVHSIWVLPNTYDFPNDSPSTATYRIPANRYGRDISGNVMPGERTVTADCNTQWTSTTDGVVTTGGGQPYNPIDTGDGANTSWLRAHLTGDINSVYHFALYKDLGDPTAYSYTSMPYGEPDRGIRQMDRETCHHIWVAPVSANTSNVDIQVTLEIEFSPYEGGAYEDMQSITIIHEHA